jgi:hypothetical protein
LCDTPPAASPVGAAAHSLSSPGPHAAPAGCVRPARDGATRPDWYFLNRRDRHARNNSIKSWLHVVHPARAARVVTRFGIVTGARNVLSTASCTNYHGDKTNLPEANGVFVPRSHRNTIPWYVKLYLSRELDPLFVDPRYEGRDLSWVGGVWRIGPDSQPALLPTTRLHYVNLVRPGK